MMQPPFFCIDTYAAHFLYIYQILTEMPIEKLKDCTSQDGLLTKD